MKQTLTLSLLLFFSFFTKISSQTDSVEITFHVDFSNEAEIEPWGGAVGIFETPQITYAEHNLNYDGDSTYSLTIKLPVDTRLEYKFKNKAAGPDFEQLDNSCSEANRFYIIPTGQTPINLDLVCYTTCEACVDFPDLPVDVTFNVDFSDEDKIESWGGTLAIFGDNFREIDLNYNGDSTYSVTTSFMTGQKVKYKFKNKAEGGDFEELNTTCSDDPREFTIPRDDDSPINLPLVCYGSCETCKSKQRVNVTFEVDLSGMDLNGQDVSIQGDFIGNNLEKMDVLGDPANQVFTFLKPGIPVGDHEVKFYLGGNSEFFDTGCSSVNNLGFRTFELTNSSPDQTFKFCFNQCECAGVPVENIFSETSDYFKIFPTVFDEKINFQQDLPFIETGELTVFDLAGKPIFQRKTNARNAQIEVNTEDWDSGIYIAVFTTKNTRFLKKIVKIQ